MAENFDLIFGQSASSQYAWNDSDYQNGWETVGSTPPTAEQFDALQRRNDTKAKDLNDRLSPLETKAEADGRQASTAYTAGTMVTVDGLPNGWLLECVVPGNSGAGAITLPETLIDGTTIVDGDVTWKLRKVATNGGLGYRQPSTAYTVGNIAYHSALPVGWYLECTTAGTSGSGALTISSPSIGGTVSDGTVVWTVQSIVDNIAPRLSTYLDDCNNVKNGTYRITSTTQNKPTNDAVLLAVKGLAGNGTQSLLQIASSLNGWEFYNRGFNDGDMSWGPWLRHEQIVAKSIGANGYIKYASGLIIQWGTLVVAGVTSVTYPISFSTTAQTVVTPVNSTQNVYATINVALLDGCSIKHSLGTTGIWCNWHAIGY